MARLNIDLQFLICGGDHQTLSPAAKKLHATSNVEISRSDGALVKPRAAVDGSVVCLPIDESRSRSLGQRGQEPFPTNVTFQPSMKTGRDTRLNCQRLWYFHAHKLTIFPVKAEPMDWSVLTVTLSSSAMLALSVSKISFVRNIIDQKFQHFERRSLSSNLKTVSHGFALGSSRSL